MNAAIEIVEADPFGVAPSRASARGYAITKLDEARDPIVQWPDTNHVQARHTGTQDGESFEENVALTVDRTRLHFGSQTRADGKEVSAFNGTLVR